MNMLVAGDLLAKTVSQQTVPNWIFVVIGVAAAGLADRIPKVRNAKAWRRWVFAGLIGAVVGVLAWCVAYLVFDVDLSR